MPSLSNAPRVPPAPTTTPATTCSPPDLSTATTAPAAVSRDVLRGSVMRRSGSAEPLRPEEAKAGGREMEHNDREAAKRGASGPAAPGRLPIDRFTPQGGDPGRGGDSMLVGIGFSINGDKEFDVRLIGDAALGLGLIRAIGQKLPWADKLQRLDPSGKIIEKIEEKTGWTHNPHADYRSGDEKVAEKAEGRLNEHHRWSEAARKHYFVKPGESVSSYEAASAFVNHLTTPIIKEFIRTHPDVSRQDVKQLHARLNELLISENPNGAGSLGKFFDGLLGKNPREGAISHGALTPKMRQELKESLNDLYKDLRKG